MHELRLADKVEGKGMTVFFLVNLLGRLRCEKVGLICIYVLRIKPTVLEIIMMLSPLNPLNLVLSSSVLTKAELNIPSENIEARNTLEIS